MSKARSASDLSMQLAEDRTWRIREISDLKTAIRRSDQIQQRVLLRALVAIAYAHWEGYVRFAAKRYLEHIALRRFPYAELDRQFLKNLFLPRLASLSQSKTSLAQRCDLIEEIFNSSEKRFSFTNEDLINTQSNLNFDVFSDICLICGVKIDKEFEDKRDFVNIFLLKRRNSIAHGEETFIEESDLDNLVDSTIGLMRHFGDELDNRATLKSYKITP